ncbi:MAG: alpha/beta hydrolase [Pseudomonadota bacterium]
MIPHIHRRSFGSGPRPALAIHCSLAHSGAWRAMGAAVGDCVTLHAFDLPCHGKSGDWDRTGIMHDTATDMARAVLDDMGEGPIDVIGHSFGATVALRLAIEDPQRIRSLTMFEPVYFAPAMADDPEFAASHAATMAPYDAAMARGDRIGAARAFNRAWGDTTGWDTIPEGTRAYMAERIQFVADSAPMLIDDSAGLLEPGRFARATMPALLMRGAHSGWMRDVNTAIARRLPDARDTVLPGVGHMGPITHPETVAKAWLTFLAEHQARQRATG